MSETIIVKIEALEWGTVRTIRVGLSYTIVFHPEHWDKMINFITSENLMDKFSFIDETGNTWFVAWGISQGRAWIEFYLKTMSPLHAKPVCIITLKEFWEIFGE